MESESGFRIEVSKSSDQYSLWAVTWVTIQEVEPAHAANAIYSLGKGRWGHCWDLHFSTWVVIVGIKKTGLREKWTLGA